MPAPNGEKWQLMVVSHTHWDREWYLPWQSFRLRLVGLFDELIDIFNEDPAYKHFMLDGHTIPLEDYLEVRPDRFDDIERIVQQGKLLIGPWYIIPDEALPGGEAHVRNFLRGHRVAKMFGPVMKVGYIPDPFGQIAHMPAILRGFGIENATMWRGADDSLKTTEFTWRAPDGSEVLTIHKPTGYGVAATLPTHPKALAARIQTARDGLEPLASTPYLLLMNGSDHLPAQADLAQIIETANGQMDDAELEHVSLPAVFERLRSYLQDNGVTPPVHEGEFRSGQRAHLLPGVLSARMWIKQMNQRCEDLLAHWAEPFSIWADSLRREMPPEWKEPLSPTTGHMPFPSQFESISALVDRAWRHLLENQPHDSICGCSTDNVHEEMRQRYKWVEQVGEEIVRQSLRVIGSLGPDHPLGTIAVFNPTPQPATGYVTADVPWSDEAPIVAVVGPDAEPTEARLVGEPQSFMIPDGAPPGYDRQRATIGFVAADVPGYGYRIYSLQTGAENSAKPVRATDGRSIENSMFAVEADATDGTLTLRDKRDGRVFVGLNRFVSGGDRGDEYNWCPPEDDTLVDRPSSPPRVSVESDAGVQRLTVELTYTLPARITEGRTARSSDTVEERITSRVTLTHGVERIDFHTTIDNAAEDHRLRVHFPSGVRATASKADQHFGVVERPLALPGWDPETWMEQPLGTYPQKAFVSVDDGKHGLAIANSGLPEYEALDTASAAEGGVGTEIAVTLLRCVGWLSRADIHTRRGGAGPQIRTPGAQLIGKHEFDYAIIPHTGDWESAEAHVSAIQHVRPMRARWNRHGIGHIEAQGTMLQVESAAFQVSAIKPADDGDGVIVRIYNTTDEEATTGVTLPLLHGDVSMVNLNEEHIAEVPRINGRVLITARRNEIVSLRFRRR